MKFHLSATVLIASVLLSGCASSRNDGRFSWEEGWRQGVVTAVGEGPAFIEKLAKSCKNANPASLQSARYATIMHKPLTGRVWITVPVPENTILKTDDLVNVNVHDCSKRIELRSS